MTDMKFNVKHRKTIRYEKNRKTAQINNAVCNIFAKLIAARF